jgi:hypothetical protein
MAALNIPERERHGSGNKRANPTIRKGLSDVGARRTRNALRSD